MARYHVQRNANCVDGHTNQMNEHTQSWKLSMGPQLNHHHMPRNQIQNEHMYMHDPPTMQIDRSQQAWLATNSDRMSWRQTTWRAGPSCHSETSSHSCPNQSLLGFNFPLQQKPLPVKPYAAMVCDQNWWLHCCDRDHVYVDDIFPNPGQHEQNDTSRRETTNINKQLTPDSNPPMLNKPKINIERMKNTTSSACKMCPNVHIATLRARHKLHDTT